jgi:hypothetical protein
MFGLLYNMNKLNIVNINDIKYLNLAPEGDLDGIVLSKGLKIYINIIPEGCTSLITLKPHTSNSL